MSADDNGVRARRLLESLADSGMVDDLVAMDAMDHETRPGWATTEEGFRGFLTRLLSDIPNLRADIHDLVAEGDRVAVRLTFHGTRSGGPERSAESRPFRVAAIGMFRFAGGKIVEHWGMMGTPEESSAFGPGP